MSRASLSSRLNRLAERQAAADYGRVIRALAAEYGEDPDQVRADVEAGLAVTRRYGRCSTEEYVRRSAEEIGVPEAEMWEEYNRAFGAVVAALGGRW